MREVKVIPSKSEAHRAMICACLAEMEGGKGCRIICDETSGDMDATAECLRALKGAAAAAAGGSRKTEAALMECGESGSTFRFMLPVAAALGISADFMPRGRLSERPLSPLYEEMVSHGCRLSPAGSIPFKVRGKLSAGEYSLPGNVSSQYITGLLLALPMLDSDSVIRITSPLESAGYVDLTLKVMADFGMETDKETGRSGYPVYRIQGGRKYTAPDSYEVEGDWSNAAFWLAAGALTEGGVRCLGLRTDSVQGDKAIVEILRRMGAVVDAGDESVAVRPGKLRGITVDAGPIPDMIPALSLLAAAAEGETRIVNAGRLRIKESDRLASISGVLAGLGADITELKDGLIIRGTGRLKGGEADGCGDHRIVMMAAAASLISDEPVVITGSEAVNKSYPTFFQRMDEMELSGNLILK